VAAPTSPASLLLLHSQRRPAYCCQRPTTQSLLRPRLHPAHTSTTDSSRDRASFWHPAPSDSIAEDARPGQVFCSWVKPTRWRMEVEPPPSLLCFES
jgi:hypothetical protein